MSLTCWAKCQCKRNCRGWFAGDPALISGCENKCKATGGDQPRSRDEYLNELGIGSQAVTAYTSADQKAQAEAAERTAKYVKIIIGLAVAVGLIIVAIKVLKKYR